MKKSTWFLLAAVVVLGVVTLLVTMKGAPPAPKKLLVAGYATPEQLEADRARGMLEGPLFIPHPVDEIDLERGGVQMRFVRIGDAKDEKAIWRVAAPVDALGVKYALEQIAQVFKTKTASRETKVFKEADAKRFGFEPGRKIRLTLKSGGAVWQGVDWFIGDVRKGDAGGGEGDADTWVMTADDPTTVFAIAGKDLRTPCDKGLEELRDKKVFDFKADDVSELGITPPGGEAMTLKATTSEVPPAPDAPPGPDGKPAAPQKTVTWALTAPAGLKGDPSVEQYAGALAGLTATAFVALDKASDEAKAALAGPSWRVSIKAGDKTTVLKIQEGGTKETVWAQIEGRNEVFSVAEWGAKGIRKGLDELEDRAALAVAPESVTALTFKTDAGPVTITRGAAGWTFTTPALPYPADPGALLGQAAKLTAIRWARKDEFEAARKALATPDIVASVAAGSTTTVVQFGPVFAGSEGAQNRWAVVGEAASGKPFLVGDTVAKRYVTTTDALRLKKLFGKAKDDLAQVTVQLAGATAVATLERPSTGGEFALVGMADGKKPSDQAIRTLLSTLSALEAKTFFDAKKPEEVGLDPAKATKIGLRLADGTTTTLWLSTQSAGENSVYAMIDAGPLANVVVGVNEFQARSLSKKPDELIDDGSGATPAPGGMPGGMPMPGRMPSGRVPGH